MAFSSSCRLQESAGQSVIFWRERSRDGRGRCTSAPFYSAFPPTEEPKNFSFSASGQGGLGSLVQPRGQKVFGCSPEEMRHHHNEWDPEASHLPKSQHLCWDDIRHSGAACSEGHGKLAFWLSPQTTARYESPHPGSWRVSTMSHTQSH